ncbi:MAG: chemotaxis protein CheB [Oligoflexus sp.]
MNSTRKQSKIQGKSSPQEEKPDSKRNILDQLAFPLVGIGASAGGLEAFTQVLKHLNIDTGMAYVLVQHLDPRHTSHLSEILSKATSIPVSEVSDGMRIEPNHIYVMPENSGVRVSSNTLKLVPRGAKSGDSHHPIDDFFYSLAAECKENAIGIVLSGTGTDGAIGIERIAAEGGITFAQDKESAKFDGMPTAAINKGVDYILTPADIGATLARLPQSCRVQRGAVHPKETSASAEEFSQVQQILALVRLTTGNDFTYYKLPTVLRRIDRRMAMHKMNSVNSYLNYLNYLKNHPDEVHSLFEDLLIKVTSFFRDPLSFQILRERVILPLLKKHNPGEAFRVWVPACATGEEAYSIAICLLEALDEINTSPKIEIFATDISEVALARARLGRYDQSIVEHLSKERLSRFFIKEGSSYRVIPAIRDRCVFAKQNVTRDPPFSKLNLISCRNLLIYLAPGIQKHVLAGFHFGLNQDGFLLLGCSETIGGAIELFRAVDPKAKIFAKIPLSHRPPTPKFVKDALDRKLDRRPNSPPPSDVTRIKQAEIKTDAERALLKFLPPSVVIDDRYFIQQFQGETSLFLIQPSGEPTTEIFKMCRPGLLGELRAAINEATVKGAPVRKKGSIMAADHQYLPVVIDVIPFYDSSSGRRSFVILFTQVAASESNRIEHTVETTNNIKRLEHELSETKDYLNAIILKEQATNEELKSASEEILSANEELQSTNEEMAITKEEIQASNEELITVNDELQSRNQELTLVNDDLANIFSSVQVPIVMLSANFTIRRFTPIAEKALNLSPEDLGTDLRIISSKLKVKGLDQLASEVLDSLITKEKDIQDGDGRWYSLRIKPYRTTDNKIDGTVIALIDIDKIKRNYERLQIAYDYADAIIQTAPIPLLILNKNLNVVTANQAFYNFFQMNPEMTQYVPIYDLGDGQWKIPMLQELLEEMRTNDVPIEKFVLEHEFPHIGQRTMQLSARCLIQAPDKPAKILLAFFDMTAEKQAEKEIRSAREAAESANVAKSDFLANISHEIRTPLGAILGYSEILADPTKTPEKSIHSATRIRKNVEQLTELIDEILDIAKIEAGKFEFDPINFSLLPELAETYALLQGRAEGKGLDFRVRFEGSIPEKIYTCPRRLRQILINVGGNALKFTEFGSVDLTVKLEPKSDGGPTKLTFILTDTGCGISPDQQTRLFQPFLQADSSVTRRYGGTGLGLILARRLAQALGGDVVLTESQINQGSTFTVLIDPGSLTGVHMLDGLTQADLERQKQGITDWFKNNQRLAGLRVLLVEDGPDNQLLLGHFLRSSGAVVEQANDGAEALDKASAGNFDLVLMDIQMPVLDGYEATKKLRSSGFTPPIIALTAHAMQGERERCIAVGCSDYISKPVKPNDLIDLIEDVLKKKS